MIVIATRQIARGALLRFAPTGLAVIGVVTIPAAIVSGTGFHLSGIAMGAIELAGLTAGSEPVA